MSSMKNSISLQAILKKINPLIIFIFELINSQTQNKNKLISNIFEFLIFK